MKRRSSNIIVVACIVIGILIFSYPIVSNYINSLHQSRVVSTYQEHALESSEDKHKELLEEAENYNKKLRELTRPIYYNGEIQDKEYSKLLSLDKGDIMGIINIDKINVQLPIYHGTSEAVLAVGAGHLEGSSLPIGGKGTHTVITGHRGLPTALLFSELDKIKEGDTFTLSVLGEILTYEVDQIRIVEPHQIDEIYIDSEQDYCTLVTCTPYGVNTHRILVRAHRITNQEVTGKIPTYVEEDATQYNPKLMAIFFILPVLLVLVVGKKILAYIKGIWYQKVKNKSKNKNQIKNQVKNQSMKMQTNDSLAVVLQSEIVPKVTTVKSVNTTKKKNRSKARKNKHKIQKKNK